jgi:hypothetical protein
MSKTIPDFKLSGKFSKGNATQARLLRVFHGQLPRASNAQPKNRDYTKSDQNTLKNPLFNHLSYAKWPVAYYVLYRSIY